MASQMERKLSLLLADYSEASSDSLLRAAREQHLEGIVGKLRDSRLRTRQTERRLDQASITLGQEFVIGGYNLAS
jgi:ATP-dependent DNA ligase